MHSHEMMISLEFDASSSSPSIGEDVGSWPHSDSDKTSASAWVDWVTAVPLRLGHISTRYEFRITPIQDRQKESAEIIRREAVQS